MRAGQQLPVRTSWETAVTYGPQLLATANRQEDDEGLTDDGTDYGSEAGGAAGEEGGEVRAACVSTPCPALPGLLLQPCLSLLQPAQPVLA